MDSKKFLFCIPSRTGCLALAYLGIVTSVAVLIYFTILPGYILNSSRKVPEDNMFSGFIQYDDQLKESLNSEEQEAVAKALYLSGVIILVAGYYLVHGMFIIFSIVLSVGAHQSKRCQVEAYFIYGFFHFLFVLVLACLHYYMEEYTATVLTVCADVFFAFCLYGVKGFLDYLKSNPVFTHPGVVYKY